MAIHDRVAGWTYEESPCELCPHTARCRAELLACARFHSFVVYGGRRWASQPCEPDRDTFVRIYGDADETDLAA